MAHSFEQNASLQNHSLTQERLVFEFSITSNATPASKSHHVDIPGVVTLRTEGKTSEADAIEDLSGSFTTPDDDNAGDSVFGLLISEIEDLDKVYKITVTEQTALAASIAVTKLGTNGKTSEGNIAFEIAGTGLNLASESPRFLVEIEYKKSR